MSNIIFNQSGNTVFTNPGAIADFPTPTVNPSRVYIVNKTSGVVSGLADGTAGQFLQTNGAGILSWVSGGGGGAIDINGLTDGYKVGSRLVLGVNLIPTGINTTVVSATLANLGTGSGNTFIGSIRLPSITSGFSNTIVGGNTIYGNFTSADANTLIGNNVGSTLISGNQNVGVGFNIFVGESGSNNICIGQTLGNTLVGGNENILIGSIVDVTGPTISHGIGIGKNVLIGINDGIFFPPVAAKLLANRIVLFDTTSGQLGPHNDTVTQNITTNNATISISGIVHIVTFAGTFTGIKLQAGSHNGQMAIVAIDPTAVGSLTLDTTPATSLVAGSANASVNLLDANSATNKVFTYIWSATAGLWMPTV